MTSRRYEAAARHEYLAAVAHAAYAAPHGYTVLTQDLDFSTILAATRGEKPSVVQIRSDNLDPDVIGAHVIDAVRKLETELDSGALLSVDPARTRVRLLPLKPKG